MVQKLIFACAGFLIGACIGIGVFFFLKPQFFQKSSNTLPLLSGFAQRQVVGFLPYWLLTDAKTDYSSYITMLTYFGLRIDTDGSILKLINPQQEEPGWYTLSSGKVDPFFASAEKQNVQLSLLLDSGDSSAIAQLIASPSAHAKTLVGSVTPLLKKYHFSDLNLDIEYTAQASDSSRANFTSFIHDVRSNLNPEYSLTIEVTGDDIVKKDLIDVGQIGKVADNIIIMAYDYHYPGSFVTGAVAPLSGAGTIAEYDVTTAMEKAVQQIPFYKIILGMPLYGYEWETLNTSARSAVIPGTGVIASSHRMDEFLASCATCSAEFNPMDQEMHVTFQDQETGTTHQIFYPTEDSTKAKLHLASLADLEGVALWALGYEGNTILNPLTQYK